MERDMDMKRVIAGVIMMILMVGMIKVYENNHYVCNHCNQKVFEAYYGCDENKDSVMCEECAEQYWITLDYKLFRVE